MKVSAQIGRKFSRLVMKFLLCGRLKFLYRYVMPFLEMVGGKRCNYFVVSVYALSIVFDVDYIWVVVVVGGCE